MSRISYLGLVVSIIFLSILPACNPQIKPSPTLKPEVTSTKFETPEKSIVSTSTSIPTPAPTLTPFERIGSSPLIALYGRDTAGKVYLYIGAMSDSSLKPVVEISPEMEHPELFPVRWSPDAKKVLYVNLDESKFQALYLYDIETSENSPIFTFGEKGKAGELIYWLPDMSGIAFLFDKEGNNSYSFSLLDIDSGELIQEYLPEDVSSHLWRFPDEKNGIKVDYPEISSSTYWPNSQEKQSDTKTFSLTTADGSSQLIATFPGNAIMPQGPELIISPDHQHAIMTSKDLGFSFLIDFSKLPYEISTQDLLDHAQFFFVDDWIVKEGEGKIVTSNMVNGKMIYYNIPEDVFQTRANNYFRMMGWSPDSQFYVYESENFAADVSSEYYGYSKNAWRFNINNIDNVGTLIQYRIPQEIDPLVSSYFGYRGFDVIWATN